MDSCIRKLTFFLTFLFIVTVKSVERICVLSHTTLKNTTEYCYPHHNTFSTCLSTSFESQLSNDFLVTNGDGTFHLIDPYKGKIKWSQNPYKRAEHSLTVSGTVNFKFPKLVVGPDGYLFYRSENFFLNYLNIHIREIVSHSPFTTPIFPGLYFIGKRESDIEFYSLRNGSYLGPASFNKKTNSSISEDHIQVGVVIWIVKAVEISSHEELWSVKWEEITPILNFEHSKSTNKCPKDLNFKYELASDNFKINNKEVIIYNNHLIDRNDMSSCYLLKFPLNVTGVYLLESMNANNLTIKYAFQNVMVPKSDFAIKNSPLVSAWNKTFFNLYEYHGFSETYTIPAIVYTEKNPLLSKLKLPASLTDKKMSKGSLNLNSIRKFIFNELYNVWVSSINDVLEFKNNFFKIISLLIRHIYISLIIISSAGILWLNPQNIQNRHKEFDTFISSINAWNFRATRNCLRRRYFKFYPDSLSVPEKRIFAKRNSQIDEEEFHRLRVGDRRNSSMESETSEIAESSRNPVEKDLSPRKMFVNENISTENNPSNVKRKSKLHHTKQFFRHALRHQSWPTRTNPYDASHKFANEINDFKRVLLGGQAEAPYNQIVTSKLDTSDTINIPFTDEVKELKPSSTVTSESKFTRYRNRGNSLYMLSRNNQVSRNFSHKYSFKKRFMSFTSEHKKEVLHLKNLTDLQKLEPPILSPLPLKRLNHYQSGSTEIIGCNKTSSSTFNNSDSTIVAPPPSMPNPNGQHLEPDLSPKLTSSIPPNSALADFIENGRFFRTFKDIELIGRGGFGSVYQARHRFEPQAPLYAIKFVTLQVRSTDNISHRRYFREVSANRDLFSRQVVRYFTWWCEEPQFLPNHHTVPISLPVATPSYTNEKKTCKHNRCLRKYKKSVLKYKNASSSATSDDKKKWVPFSDSSSSDLCSNKTSKFCTKPLKSNCRFKVFNSSYKMSSIISNTNANIRNLTSDIHDSIRRLNVRKTLLYSKPLDTEEVSSDDFIVFQNDTSNSKLENTQSARCKKPASPNSQSNEDKRKNQLKQRESRQRIPLTLLIQMEHIKGVTLRQWLDKPQRATTVEKLLENFKNSNSKTGSDKRLKSTPVEFLLFGQLVKGLRDIHTNSIVHRDIKPENIFVKSNPLSLKIGDFGLAKFLEAKSSEPSPQMYSPSQAIMKDNNWNRIDSVVSVKGLVIGTPCYAAPEGGAMCSEKADIYSASLILLELLCPRFKTVMERLTILEKFRNHQKIPEHITKHFPAWGNLIKRMGAPHPSDRPSAKNIYRLIKLIFKKMKTMPDNGF